MADSGGERIRVEAVRGATQPGAWSFGVPGGEAVWIPDEPDSGLAWLAWLTGIEPPPAGEVFWKGVEWRRRSPDEAAAERGRIGCVFAAGGLVVNLDMDENVWLPARMHRRPDADGDIERWARAFGCWPLPAVRAPAVPERMRRRILWTRAFAGRPELLVLEHPFRGVPAEDRKVLLEGVQMLRAEGAAVAWLAPALDAETKDALAPLMTAAPAST